MAVKDADTFFKQTITQLRSWGFDVREQPGCWSRSNGSRWTYGGPIGHVNHHFVISLSAPDANGVVNVTNGDSTLSGPKCNWYIGSKGVIYFISVGPGNHAGKGLRSVFDRIMANLPVRGNAASKDDWGGGNAVYAGTEVHHPGDSSPYPVAITNAVVALNAAMVIAGGWSTNRIIHHRQHSNRKIDMSWHDDIWQKVTLAIAARTIGSAIPGRGVGGVTDSVGVPNPIPAPQEGWLSKLLGLKWTS
jgi:hypothetical protein